MRTSGFTLIELMISMAIFTLLSVAIYAAVTSTAEATDTATAETQVIQGIRDVMREITSEVQVAAAENDPTLADPLFGLQVDEVGGAPVGITFQTPLDNSGDNWSEPISYVWVNEDANGNAWLDPGEDDNDDGALTRVIMRREDVNNDGDTNDPGEWRRIRVRTTSATSSLYSTAPC
jgi:prepilin-type N-terminal cleavage/methylation domain-containing protein